VIYVRVSTKEQTENLSLPTQLRACEEYCRRQGFEVLERFHEEGESAKSTDRSQLQNLLTFCRLNKGRVHFVVVFNLTRVARDKYDHFALGSHLQSLGISLRSATEPIDDTSTGKLMEGVLAAFAQFDNDVRSDRTRAGHEGRARTRSMGIPCADRLSKCAAVDGQELGPRSGASAARTTRVRGVRDRTLHEGTTAEAGESLGLDQPARLRTVRVVRESANRELVEGQKRLTARNDASRKRALSLTSGTARSVRHSAPLRTQ